MQEQLQILLSKTEIIKLRQEIQVMEDSFNIFRILKAGHEEVGLHSRFLFELLNPEGSHGMRDVFLQLFVKECKLPPLSYDKVRVLREHANIDILIQDNNRAVVIENKIYAGDQHEQLKRYFEYIKGSYRQPTLFYLTLHGSEPSEQSIGDLAETPHLISYKVEISNWITACIKEATFKPVLRETLVQYQTLVNQLTGNTMSASEKLQVLSLMAQGDNAEQAAIIARNWNHVRWHTEWDFWNDLLALAASSYKVHEKGRFSDYAIDVMVHGRRNRNPWYGLSFPIGVLNGADVNLRIERSEGPMYYGIPYSNSDPTIRNRMAAVLQAFDMKPTESWAGHKNTNAGIDIHNFANKVTLQLTNPDKRQVIVAALWQEVISFISSATVALQAEFGADFTPVG